MSSDQEEYAEYVFGDDYEPPITDEEGAHFKFVIVRAVIGYACWIGLYLYYFGG